MNCANPPANIVCTRLGNFNLRPAIGESLIPRNYGQSPGFFVLNLRILKSWSFGTMPSASAANSPPPAQKATVPAKPSGSSGGSEAKRYTAQFSLSFLNLLNSVNFGTPVGNLSSPFFGQSLNVNQYGGFGPNGSSGAGNRRVFAQVRLSF